MAKYADFNIIPLGDHCAIPLILKKLNLRKKGYKGKFIIPLPNPRIEN